MFNVAKDGKMTIEIGNFKICDYIEGSLLDIIEDFTSAVLCDSPPCLWIQTSNEEYFIICNIEECYIINTDIKKAITERVSLEEFTQSLYSDIHKYRKNIINSIEKIWEEAEHLDEIIDVNLETLLVCRNTVRDDFSFHKGNLIQSTLDAINYALYLHASGLVYDRIENQESFRIFDYERTYVIIVSPKKKKKKMELIVIERSLEEIALETYESLRDRRKLKRTKELLDIMKENLVEYGIHIDKKYDDSDNSAEGSVEDA